MSIKSKRNNRHNSYFRKRNTIGIENVVKSSVIRGRKLKPSVTCASSELRCDCGYQEKSWLVCDWEIHNICDVCPENSWGGTSQSLILDRCNQHCQDMGYDTACGGGC